MKSVSKFRILLSDEGLVCIMLCTGEANEAHMRDCARVKITSSGRKERL